MSKYSYVRYISNTLGFFLKNKNLNRAITYHEIDTSSQYSVKFNSFKDQIAYLIDNGYTFRKISDIPFVTGEKNIFITFDDAHVSSSKALDYLIGKNLQATFFLIAKDYMREKSPEERISSEEIIGAPSKLIEIGSHSYSHPILSNSNNLQTEINYGKEILENFLEKKIESFALPYGKNKTFTLEVLEAIKEAGFHYCCTQIPAPLTFQDDFLVPRIGIRKEDQIKDFHNKLNGNFDYLKFI